MNLEMAKAVYSNVGCPHSSRFFFLIDFKRPFVNQGFIITVFFVVTFFLSENNYCIPMKRLVRNYYMHYRDYHQFLKLY